MGNLLSPDHRVLSIWWLALGPFLLLQAVMMRLILGVWSREVIRIVYCVQCTYSVDRRIRNMEYIGSDVTVDKECIRYKRPCGVSVPISPVGHSSASALALALDIVSS